MAWARKPVFGVGINDVEESTWIILNGKRVKNPYYKVWVSMLNRCYSDDWHNKHPSYKYCTVYDEWLYFSKFKAWMEQQDWEGKQLDKDLLVSGNKVYSPYTCLFVSQALNKSLLLRGNDRGEEPLGACYHKASKRYTSDIMTKGGRSHLGLFDSAIEAHRAWQLAKIKVLDNLKDSQPDFLVKIGLQRIIDKIQDDYDNNRETTDFN